MTTALAIGRHAMPAVMCAGGMGLLLARPWLAPGGQYSTAVLVVLFVALGAAGMLLPIPDAGEPACPRRVDAVAVLGIGASAFVVGRVLGGGIAAAPALASYLVLNSLAAIAEEAFFRRFVYGALAPLGPATAIAGSAVAFAVIHVTMWGPDVLPLDLAAGLVLSWQRWASGRWPVPAATHVLANVLAVA